MYKKLKEIIHLADCSGKEIGSYKRKVVRSLL